MVFPAKLSFHQGVQDAFNYFSYCILMQEVIDAAYVQLLHFETGWVKGFYEILESPGTGAISRI